MGKRTHIQVIDVFFLAIILLGNKKKAFNGEQEFGSTSQPLSGEEILRKIDVICNSWEKNKITRGKLNVKTINCWKKKFIFFDLE